jgi:hypothetical protein
MGRSGYTDDFDDDNTAQLYRQAVRNAIVGGRGQRLLRRLRDALYAMPDKRLIAGAIKDESGQVCAFGALDPNAPSPASPDEWDDDLEHAGDLAKHFGIARALAAEIVYMNDEWGSWRMQDETPEARWVRMRRWVDEQIRRDEAQDASVSTE